VRQDLAIVIDLSVLSRRRVGDAVGVGKQPVEIVEAAVLGVDDDDVLDLVESALRGRGRLLHAVRKREGAEPDRGIRN
jgi:hypothetical protein